MHDLEFKKFSNKITYISHSSFLFYSNTKIYYCMQRNESHSSKMSNGFTCSLSTQCFRKLLFPPLDLQERRVSFSPILVGAPLGVFLGDNKHSQTPVFFMHSQKFLHFIAISGSIVPTTPVAGQLWKFDALDVHVLNGAGHCTHLFPLGQTLRARLPPHHNGNHV